MKNDIAAHRLWGAKRLLLTAGLISIAISSAAWVVDLTGVTYACPYCRVERSVIGLLGIAILLVPVANAFILRYASVAVAALGLGVATTQNFNTGWMKMFEGSFEFHSPVWFDTFILSGCATIIIAFQLGIIFEQSGSTN